MARYTELFIEYLNNGHELPTEFSLIEGFGDLFVSWYMDKEIGFETEELFEAKLSMVAGIVIPLYKARLDRLAQAWLKFDTPTSVFYESETITNQMGAQKTKSTELPIDEDTAEPSMVNDADAYTNTQTRTKSNGDLNQIENSISFLNAEARPLVVKLINEFSNLFMKVY